MCYSNPLESIFSLRRWVRCGDSSCYVNFFIFFLAWNSCCRKEMNDRLLNKYNNLFQMAVAIRYDMHVTHISPSGLLVMLCANLSLLIRVRRYSCTFENLHST